MFRWTHVTNSNKKLNKLYLTDGDIQTTQKGAYCLNYSKLKTSIFTGSRDAITKQQCIIFHLALIVSIQSLHSDISFYSIEIKAIWILWKIVGQGLIASTVFVRKNNNCLVVLGRFK